jgi:hypothetical protein
MFNLPVRTVVTAIIQRKKGKQKEHTTPKKAKKKIVYLREKK